MNYILKKEPLCLDHPLFASLLIPATQQSRVSAHSPFKARQNLDTQERTAMNIIEIPENSNCQPMDMRIFHDLERSRVVEQVRLEREPGRPEWFEVVGWTDKGLRKA